MSCGVPPFAPCLTHRRPQKAYDWYVGQVRAGEDDSRYYSPLPAAGTSDDGQMQWKRYKLSEDKVSR